MDIVREEFSLKMAPNFRGCQSYIFDVVKVVSSQLPRTQETKKSMKLKKLGQSVLLYGRRGRLSIGDMVRKFEKEPRNLSTGTRQYF